VNPKSGCKGQDSPDINCWIVTGTMKGSCCSDMDSATVSAAREPTWGQGGTEVPEGQRYQGVGGVGGWLTALIPSTNLAQLRSWGVKTWKR
jgi:hypothetical protein